MFGFLVLGVFPPISGRLQRRWRQWSVSDSVWSLGHVGVKQRCALCISRSWWDFGRRKPKTLRGHMSYSEMKVIDIVEFSIVITKASYASWSSSCFSKEHARSWISGFLDSSRLNPPLPPAGLVTLRSWVQPPLRPSSQKQWYLLFTVLFALQGRETQVKCIKMHSFEIFRLPFHLGCLDRLQIQQELHEEKTFHRGCVLHDGRVGFHLGGVLFRHV